PLLGGDRPALVVSPSTSDLQISLGESFSAESEAPDKRNRPSILRLYVRLEPMESQPAKCCIQHQREALGHIPAASVWQTCVKPQICRLEDAANNLGNIDDAGNDAGIPNANQESIVPFVLQPLAVCGPGQIIQRRIYPGPEKPEAAPIHFDDFAAVARPR